MEGRLPLTRVLGMRGRDAIATCVDGVLWGAWGCGRRAWVTCWRRVRQWLGRGVLASARRRGGFGLGVLVRAWQQGLAMLARVHWRVGSGLASWRGLTGRPVPTEEAFAMGLANGMVGVASGLGRVGERRGQRAWPCWRGALPTGMLAKAQIRPVGEAVFVTCLGDETCGRPGRGPTGRAVLEHVHQRRSRDRRALQVRPGPTSPRAWLGVRSLPEPGQAAASSARFRNCRCIITRSPHARTRRRT